METKYNNHVLIPANGIWLKGELFIPADAQAIIIFSHGSGSSRLSPRNLKVAQYLQQRNFGTLLFDLLTPEEDSNYRNRFAIDLLKDRLIQATRWLKSLPASRNMSLAYFGASTGAASALKVAAQQHEIFAVVSRGGRADLAMNELAQVKAPTLLVVGSEDAQVLYLNQVAYQQLRCKKKLKIIPGANHLFDEPGKLEEVAELAANWFSQFIPATSVSN